MIFYPNQLSENHRRMLFEESANAPEYVAERGYYTAQRRSEVPGVFADYQRRSGLVVPMFSPDGESTGYQLRPDKPRRGGPKYETPAGSEVLVDVHPRMIEEVRSGTGDLGITEGVKKGDALTSRGLPTLALGGVWMWCVPKVKPYKLKPCFDHVRLRGRRVYIVFDSDALTKPEVQQALEALVKALEERGAEVLVAYLEDAPNGSKVGADDHLAAGGTVSELKMLARKFEPTDMTRVRLSRDDRLRALVENLRRTWWAEEWKARGGHSDRDIAYVLIEAAARSGKVHPDGVRVEMSWGVIEVRAKVSRRTLKKALARLEERGFLYRDNDGRKANKTGAFVLRAKVNQNGGRAAEEKKAAQEVRGCPPPGLPSRALPDVPRLRWSRPAFAPKRRGFARGTRCVRESKPLPARERIERLGKIRGAVVDTLQGAGGELELGELCRVLNKKRPRDVRRRVLPMLEEAGIVEVAGNTVRLAREWREALEAERRAKGEGEADELAEERRKRKSQAYRERNKAPTSKPSPAGLAAIERSREKRAENVAAHEERQSKARAADLEHSRFVKRFVYDRLRTLGRIRLELLQEVLKDAGGTPAYALPAAKSLGCTVERLPEFGNAEFVFAPRTRGEEGAA
jgi:ribosomal protein S19E (S16A)